MNKERRALLIVIMLPSLSVFGYNLVDNTSFYEGADVTHIASGKVNQVTISTTGTADQVLRVYIDDYEVISKTIDPAFHRFILTVDINSDIQITLPALGDQNSTIMAERLSGFSLFAYQLTLTYLISGILIVIGGLGYTFNRGY